MSLRARPVLLLALGALPLGPSCDCDDAVTPLVPSLVVTPSEAHIQNAPVAQDTEIVFRIENDRQVSLEGIQAFLVQGSDPAFDLVEESVPLEVLPGFAGEIVVLVRPMVVSTIEAKLMVLAEPRAVPNRQEVPIVVDAIDVGVPDIEVDPAALEFARTGQADVNRATIAIDNVGARDLVLDEVFYDPDVDGDETIRLATPLPPGQAVGPGEGVSVDVVFAPEDLVPHAGALVIRSNDPDEPEVRVPLSGIGAACPTAVAVLVDDPESIEPLDTVRVDGHDSEPASPETTIESYEWSIEQRPIGSTAVPSNPASDRTELTVDIAGQYVMSLHVYDNTGVRSCVPALVSLDVIPTEDLHIQLIWDHPTADFDLHLLNEGGVEFTHEGDCYFSNRQPEWSANPDENPSLDADDDRGYGPENVNVKHPAPGSQWSILVHYWNQQTDGSPTARATLRVFTFGQQAIELTRTFESDQQLWRAIDLTWPPDEDTDPQLDQIGVLEEFPRPF